MHPQPASATPTTDPGPAARRRPTLHELVRDLAGWTLPPRPTPVSSPRDGWALAWTSR